MPVWLILLVAGLLVAGGAVLPVVLTAKRRRSESFRTAVAEVRSRIEALEYRLDGLAPGVDASRVLELRDTAQAMVSAADERQSARVCRQADAVVSRAEAALATARMTS